MAEKFNTGIAERFGITAALLLEHIWREVKENEFHHRHCYEGNTWMRCSKKAFTVHMPYLSRGMITCGIGRLKKAGILVQGEHNGSRFDRTAFPKHHGFQHAGACEPVRHSRQRRGGNGVGGNLRHYPETAKRGKKKEPHICRGKCRQV